jgi:hypothetical protein
VSSHWERFYSGRHTLKPSPFARFIATQFNGANIIELGCGNGRDSYFLGRTNRVVGVDSAFRPADRNGTRFVQKDVAEAVGDPYSYDVLYARFFLHAIPEALEDKILAWNQGVLTAEFRSVGDEPLRQDHYRRLIDGERFLGKLLRLGYEIQRYEKGRGLAKFGEEDPLIIRVIARRAG